MMAQVFISYASKDKFFAELLATKLEERKISVWRDVAAIRVGEEWRDSIDRGIRESAALVLAMSAAASASHYVTYEWATAAAYGKTIIPVLLDDCSRHPKIEPIQYMDFRHHNESSWEALAQRVLEILDQAENQKVEDVSKSSETDALTEKEELARSKIKSYLNRKGFRLVSFVTIRRQIDSEFNDKFLNELIKKVEEFTQAKVRVKGSETARSGIRWL